MIKPKEKKLYDILCDVPQRMATAHLVKKHKSACWISS